MKYLSLLLLALISSCRAGQSVINSSAPPNIIYILADDLGYGDLSCYGQEKFSTPNIDALAARGMRFTQHYSGSTVCAPSRSVLMTGQHTGHTAIRNNKRLPGEGQTPLPAGTITIAEVLQNAGYRTGAFGKWGLGFVGTEGDPLNVGFDEFYGYNCQRMAHRYYPTYLWQNANKVELPGNDWTQKSSYAPDAIQNATLQFLKKSKSGPFFAYVPLILPHAELIVPEDSIWAKFEGKYPEPKPYVGKKYSSDYGPDLVPSQYAPQPMPRAAYAAMVTRIDTYVGQIIAKVEELGLTDNTLIIFTSDNGPAMAGGADPDFFNGNGGLRGYKRDLYEGGIRAPFIASWPNKIDAGTTSHHVSTFWDMMPTFARIANQPVPPTTDGISMLPTLIGKGEQDQHKYLYWEFSSRGGRKAVRADKWKLVAYNLHDNPDRNPELYNLSADPEEANNVAATNPEVVARLLNYMDEAHEESELFPFK